MAALVAEKLAVAGEAESCPSIVLAGKEWPIPLLSPKQNRIVVPAILELFPKIIKAGIEAKDAGETGNFAYLRRFVDTVTYDRLCDVAFTALTRAHPQLTRSEFDDLAVDTLELVAAVNVIGRQAGLLRPVPAQETSAA